jgi:hypothetical protein
MAWHHIVMHGERDLATLISDLTNEYARELVEGKRSTYDVYRSDESNVLIPPATLHLAERVARWKPRLTPCASAPDLSEFRKVTLP